jgi:deoxyribonuclease V
MRIRHLHPWDVTSQEAVQIQEALRGQLHHRGLGRPIRYVAGADVASAKKFRTVWAAVVVYSYPELHRIESVWAKDTTQFPYISGLLSFREIPPILRAFEFLEIEPDPILCDGQGIAHPRGFGLASHLGVLTGKATVGCAKTRLVGAFSEVGKNRGDFTGLLFQNRQMGAVVRTRTGVKPLFVSPGYGITVEEAIEVVLRCATSYRIPEPIRQADILVRGLRRDEEAS